MRLSLGPLGKLLLLGLLLVGVRACHVAATDRSAGIDLDQLALASPGPGFPEPPDQRRVIVDGHTRIDELEIAQQLRRSGGADLPQSFGWEIEDRLVTLVAPGTDGRHHFANAYLVNYVPYEGVETWVPLYALARRKAYEYDHLQYGGASEIWQTSREAFYYPRGDCEDHALALADWLIGLGHDARVVLGKHGTEGHAWVVLIDGDNSYLLESTAKGSTARRAIPLAEQLPDYHPEIMFNRDSFWTNAGDPMTTLSYTLPQWRLRSRFERGPAN